MTRTELNAEIDEIFQFNQNYIEQPVTPRPLKLDKVKKANKQIVLEVDTPEDWEELKAFKAISTLSRKIRKNREEIKELRMEWNTMLNVHKIRLHPFE